MPDNLPAGILNSPGQGLLLNPALMAFNAFEIDVPQSVIDMFSPFLVDARQCESTGRVHTFSGGYRFNNVRPAAWQSDICWLSHADEPTYRLFHDAFDGLGFARTMAPLIEHDREIQLYAGFLVTRSSCSALDMHFDWLTTGNQAMTLMTPLTANCADLGMTYETVRKERRDLHYRLGKGLVFGPGFRHSTAVGQLAERSVFLCLNFGTDRMDNWPELAATAGTQCDLMCEPDGRFSRLEDRIARGVISKGY